MAGLHDVLTPAGASLTVYQGLSGPERTKLFGSAALARNAVAASVAKLLGMLQKLPAAA